jgi:drug/metabolite transporter (DMT)-like permease
MTWVLYASFMPLLWSLGNVLDQYIAREAFQRSAFSFLIISGLVTIPLAIALGVLNPHVLQIPWPTILILIAGGVIGFAGAWPYIIALTEDDASNAIPVLQTVPVFVYLLGFLLLGETLTWVQMLGAALVVSGAVAFVWNPHTRKIHTRTLFLMLASSLIWAGYAVWIRYWAQELPWITVTFWNYAAWCLLGLVGVVLSRPIMGDFKALFKPAVRHIFLPILFAQQFFACTADMLQTRALSLAPTGVQVILFNGIQPVVIMLLCGLFYYWRPDIYQRVQWNRRLAIRFTCVAVTLIGLALLLQV